MLLMSYIVTCLVIAFYVYLVILSITLRFIRSAVFFTRCIIQPLDNDDYELTYLLTHIGTQFPFCSSRASRSDCFCSSIQSWVSWAAILFRACQRGPIGSVTPVFPGAPLEPETPEAIQIIIRFESRSKLYKQYSITNKHLLLMKLNYSCELACHSSGSIKTRSLFLQIWKVHLVQWGRKTSAGSTAPVASGRPTVGLHKVCMRYLSKGMKLPSAMKSMYIWNGNDILELNFIMKT